MAEHNGAGAVGAGWRALRRYGLKEASRRAARRGLRGLEARLHLDELDQALLPGDEAAAWDEPIGRPGSAPTMAPTVPLGSPLRIGWVCVPPTVGSGGHTTFFRMARAAAERGHECTIVLYEAGAINDRAATLRRGWPWLELPVMGIDELVQGRFDALVASSWPTAYGVRTRGSGTHGFYFVQDHEPAFHPRGYVHHLASRSYHLGLDTVALGGGVRRALELSEGVHPDLVVPFGCDRSVYRLLQAADGAAPRSGVVHYVRARSDRRGHPLAVQALRRFHELRPDQEIHLFGDRVAGWGVPVTQHGILSPTDLNVLYNRVRAGLALSFTNLSLVPTELMAAGVVAVVNDLDDVRLDQSAGCVWAAPTPEALARALADVVDDPDPESTARRLAALAPGEWDEPTQRLVRHLERRCAGLGDERPRAAEAARRRSDGTA